MSKPYDENKLENLIQWSEGRILQLESELMEEQSNLRYLKSLLKHVEEGK